MPTEKLYVPLQRPTPPVARIGALGSVPAARKARPARAPGRLERMRHPFATMIQIARRDGRRLVLDAPANWGVVGLAVGFVAAAYAVGLWALTNGAFVLDTRDTFLMGIVVLVLLHVALRYLFAPLGGEQAWTFDKQLGTLAVLTRGLWGDRVDRYPLREIVKVHVNLVDDGIYDPGTVLVIFRGGGTLQLPAHPGVPAGAEAACEAIARFLGVARSDRPAAQVAPLAPAPFASVDTLDLDELALEAWLRDHPPTGSMR